MLTPFALGITYILSVGIAALNIFVVVSFVFFIAHFFTKDTQPTFFASKAYPLAFLVALGALLSSLYYSNVVGLIPCELCWYQRLFFYPQVIVLCIALLNKDFRVQKYTYYIILTLSVIGALIAGYHYYGQIFDPSTLPCGITQAESLCAQIPFKTFGYITIPMMSLIGFLAQIALMVWYKISHHHV